MENKILELEKKLQDMELKYNHLFEIVEELNYYFLREMSEPSESIYSVGGYSWTPLIIPRDNLEYLKSDLSCYYDNKDGMKVYTPKLTVNDIKNSLRNYSPSDIIKGIKKAGIVGCLAPKHLWSIYDKVEKLKKQEKNKIKESNSNKDVIAEKYEIEQILQYLKFTKHHYYLMIRILVETGMRIGELVDIEYENVDTEKRRIVTVGKSGRKPYYTSKDLANELEYYIKHGNFPLKYLFYSRKLRQYDDDSIRVELHNTVKRLEIKKNITPHTFRRTINTLRYKMGCPDKELKILLNHKITDVNFSSYTKLKYEEYIRLYDKWFPYNDIAL